MTVDRLGIALACFLLACGNSGPPKQAEPVPPSRWRSSPVGAPVKQAIAAPPISLTAGDGTGLAMTRLDARAAVDGPLAFTELHLTFQNPQDRVIEGRFAITLPDNAAISRFAMKINGQWMEAEMVERRGAARLRGLPAPPPGSGAAREGGRQRVPRPGVPDPGRRGQGADRRLLAGARRSRRAVRAAAARPAADRRGHRAHPGGARRGRPPALVRHHAATSRTGCRIAT